MATRFVVVLSADEGSIESRYDVVVIGSGYGGAIAASRFARAGKRVCVLERGAERWPGDYPENLWSAARDTQIHARGRRYGSPLSLYDMRFDDEVNVLVGCGLGGTSLINANVALRPLGAVFADRRWPSAIRELGGDGLVPYFERAERWLGSNPYPTDGPSLPKLEALGVIAEALGVPMERAPVNVTFDEATNAAGVTQPACNNCGNCISGCNVGSKNTVLMNYLPDAVHHGAQIFTERSVDWIEEGPGRRSDSSALWRVVFHQVGSGRRRFHAPRQFVHADLVVVAAGTMGSTEIMLRSRERGLNLSDRLGDRFNGNGDVLGFGYDSDRDLRAVGWAGRRKDQPVGPTISGVVPVLDRSASPVDRIAELSESERLADDALVIEEGAIPGVLRSILPLTLLYTAISASDASPLRKFRMLFGSWVKAARNTLTYLVMSNDDDGGRLSLTDDRLGVDWPTGPTGVHVRRNNDLLANVSAAIGADYAPEMLYTKAMGHQLVTVHPLGGCVMADDASVGVVDDTGAAFVGSSGNRTHRGLHVLDGSIIARPLDTNPSLTISALTERAVELIADRRGWDTDLTPTTTDLPTSLVGRFGNDGPAAPSTSRGDGNAVFFTERMAGWFGLGAEDHEAGRSAGKADASPLSFVVTIAVDDLDGLESDPAAAVRFGGTVEAPRLSPEPLMVGDGEFRLLTRNDDQAEAWNMSYRMTLTSIEGRRYRFEGHKVITTGSMWRGWSETTTLYVTISDEDDLSIGKGILEISTLDLMRQLATIDAPDRSFVARQRAKFRFARAFTGAFLPIYGGLLAEDERHLHQPLPATRSLELPPPEFSIFAPPLGWRPADDAVGDEATLSSAEHTRRHGTSILASVDPRAELMLTHYPGGTKGPVLLAAGFSMRASSFAETTNDSSLAEALHAAGHDVWLFDYRASIALPSCRSEFTIDDIAQLDWQRAVDEVRRQTGATSVGLVGHCVGSVTILMALLDGLTGVHTAVCSQFPLHPSTSRFNRFKNALRLTDALALVGVRRLRPSVSGKFADRVIDLAAGVLPVPRGEACQVPMCRWLNAIFGLTHTHDQINAATHESFTSAFGIGEVTPLRHLSLMLRTGRALDHRGNDHYLPNVDRLDLPILFIQGGRNYIFKPKGMAKTLDWLRSHHGNAKFDLLYLADYAHLDGIVGKNAAVDVFPRIVEHLDAHAGYDPSLS